MEYHAHIYTHDHAAIEKAHTRVQKIKDVFAKNGGRRASRLIMTSVHEQDSSQTSSNKGIILESVITNKKVVMYLKERGKQAKTDY